PLAPTPFPYTTLFRSYGERIERQRGREPLNEVVARFKHEFVDFNAPVCPDRVQGHPAAGSVSRHDYPGIARGLGPAGVEFHDRRSEEHTSELQSRENL